MPEQKILKIIRKLEKNPTAMKIINSSYAKIFFTVSLIVVSIVVLTNPDIQNGLARMLGLNTNYETISERNMPDGVEVAKVVEVVDGDTVELENGDRVRYLNVDTPETKKPGTSVKCYGPEASEFNKKSVEGKTVYLTADKSPTDRYDRLLRFVFTSLKDTNDVTKSVNAKLVQQGYAKVVVYRPNTTFEDDFRKIEKEAIEKNIGVWKNCPKPFEE